MPLDGTIIKNDELRAELGFDEGVQFLTDAQYELVHTDKKFPAFVGGFGSGKTGALVERAIKLKLEFYSGNIGYYLPTYDLIEMIALPRFEEKLTLMGLPHKIYKGARPKVDIEDCGTIYLRSMNKPGRIVGYETTDSLLDELDTLKEADAEKIWRMVMARNRQKKRLQIGPDTWIDVPNTMAVGTTPEGFKFVYKRWQGEVPKGQEDNYHIIHASTYSNAHNLPADYIPNLIGNYPAALIDAYLNGIFTNLESGSVYKSYNRVLNRSTETILGPHFENGILVGGEDLHIGMDFNVQKMAAVIYVNRWQWPHAVAELTGVYDTPAMIEKLKEKYPSHRITVYPDASGKNRHSSDASTSDLALLRQAGFIVKVKLANPFVKDRVNAVNGLLCNARGVRRMYVNDRACPKFAEALEKQPYDDDGDPDKKSGYDHIVDAGGYFVAFQFPVIRVQAGTAKLLGV